MKMLHILNFILSFSAIGAVPKFQGENDLMMDLEIDAIIDLDTRDRVRHHHDPVSKAVGLFENGSGFCTATLITKRHILTNGHCVTKTKSPPHKFISLKDVKFTLGKLSADDEGFGIFGATRIQTFSQWVTKGNLDFDVALITLDRPVTGVDPVIVRLHPTARSFKNYMLTINGYSSDKPFGSQWSGNGFFEETTERNSFLHTIDTLPGTSGAMIRRRIGNKWVGVGIHRGSQTDTRGEATNRAVMFNSTVFSTIVNWIKN